MNLLNQILPFVIIAGALHGFFLAFIILYNARSSVNKTLAFHLFLFGFIIMVPELLRTFPKYFAHLLGTIFPLFFLFGPSLYLYVRMRVNNSKNIRRSDFLHGIPFVLATLLMLPTYLQSSSIKIEFIDAISTKEGRLPILWIVGWTLELIHIIIYLIACTNTLKRISHKPVSWLSVIVKANLAVWSIYLVWLIFTIAVDDKSIYSLPYYTFGLFISILVYSVGYKAILDKNVLKENSAYVKSHLTDEVETESLQKKLLKLVEEDKIHHNPEISLLSLSESLLTSPNKLSELLNKKMGQNFNDFINCYRVRDAKKSLRDNDDLTIIEIAYDVGFQSKSTFNKSFKKFTNMTPTEFLERLKKSKASFD